MTDYTKTLASALTNATPQSTDSDFVPYFREHKADGRKRVKVEPSMSFAEVIQQWCALLEQNEEPKYIMNVNAETVDFLKSNGLYEAAKEYLAPKKQTATPESYDECEEVHESGSAEHTIVIPAGPVDWSNASTPCSPIMDSVFDENGMPVRDDNEHHESGSGLNATHCASMQKVVFDDDEIPGFVGSNGNGVEYFYDQFGKRIAAGYYKIQQW